MFLCGHCYGGRVITGVADRMPDRLKALIYLDVFLPESGDSLIGFHIDVWRVVWPSGAKLHR